MKRSVDKYLKKEAKNCNVRLTRTVNGKRVGFSYRIGKDEEKI